MVHRLEGQRLALLGQRALDLGQRRAGRAPITISAGS